MAKITQIIKNIAFSIQLRIVCYCFVDTAINYYTETTNWYILQGAWIAIMCIAEYEIGKKEGFKKGVDKALDSEITDNDFYCNEKLKRNKKNKEIWEQKLAENKRLLSNGNYEKPTTDRFIDL